VITKRHPTNAGDLLFNRAPKEIQADWLLGMLSASFGWRVEQSREGLNRGEYGPPRKRRSEVGVPEVRHQGFPHSFSALFEDLRAKKRSIS
jgi:hypothetical protein